MFVLFIIQYSSFIIHFCKGEYQTRYDEIAKLYEGVKDANIENELTSELVGDYLFTDSDFISKLSTENRNVFQKIYDEIKYLCKVATAGSKEARQLEKVKRAFEKAYKESGKAEKNTAEGGVRYSIQYEKATVNEDIVSLIEKVKNRDYKDNNKVEFGIVSKKAANEIKKISGIDVSGYKMVIEARQIYHILKDHGIDGKSDQSMSNDNDIAKMEIAFNSYDKISNGGRTKAYTYMKNGHNKTAPTVLYEKEIGEKSYYVVQAVPETKKRTLYVVTAFIGKKGYKKEASQLINAKSLDVTAKTGSVVTSNNIISNPNENVKQNTNLSLSSEKTTPKKYGNYNVYGEDITLQPNEDIAPVREDVQPIKQTETLTGDIAPVREDIAPIKEKKKEYISFEDFANKESPVWRNVDYEDSRTQKSIMSEVYKNMVNDGSVIEISDDVKKNVAQSYPDLRYMKKKERTPILKEAMEKLKNNIREFLGGLKNQSFEFEVNGKILEAKLYNTGINEVLEKITQEKAGMLYSTEDIFRNARYLYSTPDYDGDTNVYRWNYFYTPVKIDENVVGVRIAVRDLIKQGESQIYNWGIKKDTSLDGVGDDSLNRKSHDVSSDVSNRIIPEKEQKVNTEDIAPVRDDIAPIKTVEDRITAKIKNYQEERSNNIRLREKSNAEFDRRIAEAQAEYDAKKNKKIPKPQTIFFAA